MNPRSPDEPSLLPLRERIRQATAAAILDAADQVYGEQGVDGVRMNDIAARAGVAVGTLYNHFADRDALFDGLLERRRIELLELLDGALEASGLAFRERLERVFSAFFEYFERHRGFYNLWSQCEMAGAAARNTPMAREIYARMEKLVRRGVREKALRSSGTELYPALLMGAIKALFVRERLFGTPISAGDAREALRCFLEGVGA
jgi:AcrR family transcriptional regulator